ncbi:MAG: FtsX-like permease family protein [Candidatus Saccharimonadales bacterium]
MKLIDITRRAGRSLRNAKARTLLTSLAIGVGAFTITLSLAAGTGGKQYIEEIISSNVNPRHIMVTKVSDHPDGLVEYSESGKTSLDAGDAIIDTLNKKDIETIQRIPGVQLALPSLGTSPLYITNESGSKKFELGMIAEYDGAIAREYSAGNPSATLGDGVVISDEYRKALGFTSPQDSIGQTVKIALMKGDSRMSGVEPRMFEFTVSGVTKKNDIAAAVGAPVLVSYSRLEEMHNYQIKGTRYEGNYMYITAIVRDNADIVQVKHTIESRGYRAQTAEDLMQFIFQFVNVLQGILLGFGALAVLTAIFGIINTQYISVLERTQQIGLMKALGMRRRDVGRLFKLEAAWIGFLGGALGSGAALATGTAANPFIRERLTLGEHTNLLIFEPWIFAVVIVGLMLVSVGAGILPARKASKLDPIEALRTE